MTHAQTIAAWLLLAINAWGASPVPAAEQDRTAELRAQIASSMLAVAYDPEEPPIYGGPNGRALTALTLASIGSLESRFVERIMRGRCHPGECDGGKATGLLQVHLGANGLRFVGARAEQCHRYAPGCLLPEDLAGDISLQIRAGLHMLRTQGFRAFTRSAAMRAQAAEWVRVHPVPVLDAEVTP